MRYQGIPMAQRPRPCIDIYTHNTGNPMTNFESAVPSHFADACIWLMVRRVTGRSLQKVTYTER